MPYKNPHMRLLNQRKQSHRGRARRKELKKTFMREAKDKPCFDCGGRFPFYVMQFDHRDPALKSFDISDMKWSDKSLSRVIEEMAKCDVVCANCHAIRTYVGKHFVPRARRNDPPKPQLTLFTTKS